MPKAYKNLSCQSCECLNKGVFCGLQNEKLGEITENKVMNTYRKGQTLFFEGNPSFGVYCINSGKIKISKTCAGGKESILRIAGPGDILGHQQLYSGENFVATATVIEEASVCFIDKKFIFKAIESNPSLAQNLIRVLSKEMSVMEERSAALTHKNVRERLAELLLMLKSSYGLPVDGTNKWRLDIRLTREEMASMVGTANETVIRFISEFREEGMLEQEGKVIYLTNIEKLAKTASLT